MQALIRKIYRTSRNSFMKKERNTLNRRSEILQLLEKQNDISVITLSKMYDISEVSIRNDLTQLENKGLLIRTRGGAIKKKPFNFDLNLNQRLKKNYIEKQNIGIKAIEYINEGSTIVMDSGSTTLEVAKNLKSFKKLKLITNSIPIAEIVADYKGIEVIMPGGVLRSEMRSLVGSMTESNLLNYYCDIAFIGTDSISCDYGISTSIMEEATLNQTMMKIAKKVIVVTDSSKFQRRSFVKIADITKIDTIITDKNIPVEELQKLKKLPIEVVLL